MDKVAEAAHQLPAFGRTSSNRKGSVDATEVLYGFAVRVLDPAVNGKVCHAPDQEISQAALQMVIHERGSP